MTQAWQAREAKQQEFVETLCRQVQDATEHAENGGAFLVTIGKGILEQAILCKDGRALSADYYATPTLVELGMNIRNFARVPSEVPYLWYLLFLELEPSLFAQAHGDYHSDGLHHPIQVYGAERTAEVPDDF